MGYVAHERAWHSEVYTRQKNFLFPEFFDIRVIQQLLLFVKEFLEKQGDQKNCCFFDFHENFMICIQMMYFLFQAKKQEKTQF